VIEIGAGQALIYPGNYEEFLWSRRERAEATTAAAAVPAKPVAAAPANKAVQPSAANRNGGRPSKPRSEPVPAPQPDKAAAQQSYDERRRVEADARRVRKAADSLRRRVDDLEARIAEREKAIKEIEATMSAPGFYDDRDAARPVIDRHQALMWEVGDLMNQWEALQTES
jgi:hypothetical protein